MKALHQAEVWFLTGSQHLYGKETLERVAENARSIAGSLNDHKKIPVNIVFKPVLTNPEEIVRTFREAASTPNCIGLIVWMHTFSPAKMWIGGLKLLQLPLLHFHTQYNRDIPWSEIDMDFMNLNQSAHGDREFGHLTARMKIRRKVVAGHWKDSQTIDSIAEWCRAAAGWHDLQYARFVRFGDNMRQVAVTEGDKVEAEIVFGYSVNTHGVGDLIQHIDAIADQATERLCAEYADHYTIPADLLKGGARHASLCDAARIELGILSFLTDGGYKGFTNTFEDLHGLRQLPGIATQRLMAKGYGFGAEGDWKTAALVRAMKTMGRGLPGGSSFMEDYTYHLDPSNPLVLGAHMLEICPTIASAKPSLEIHPLGIGGREDPVRLVFTAGAGPAINASIVDLGNRFRMLVNEVVAVAPIQGLPRLPVARVLWKPYPDMHTGCASWIIAGGAHHTCYSQHLTVGHMRDFAEMAGIELITIGKDTGIDTLKQELRLNDVFYK